MLCHLLWDAALDEVIHHFEVLADSLLINMWLTILIIEEHVVIIAFIIILLLDRIFSLELLVLASQVLSELMG